MPIGWPRATAPPFTLTTSGAEPEVVHRGEGDGGEGFVDLEQVDLAELVAAALERIPDGARRLGQERGVGAGDLAVADDLAERHEPERLGPARPT